MTPINVCPASDARAAAPARAAQVGAETQMQTTMWQQRRRSRFMAAAKTEYEQQQGRELALPAGTPLDIYAVTPDGGVYRLLVEHRVKTATLGSRSVGREWLSETWPFTSAGYEAAMARTLELNITERDRLAVRQ